MKRIDSTTISDDRFNIIDDILESLTDKQLGILRERIVDICNTDYEGMITMSYFDLVTELFFYDSEIGMRNFEDLSDEEIKTFIANNKKPE